MITVLITVAVAEALVAGFLANEAIRRGYAAITRWHTLRKMDAVSNQDADHYGKHL